MGCGTGLGEVLVVLAGLGGCSAGRGGPAFLAPVLAEWRTAAGEEDHNGTETEGDQGNVLEHDEDEQMNQDKDEQNQDEPTEHTQHTPLYFTQPLVAASTSTQSLPPFTLHGEDVCIRLVRYFMPFFTRALEALYPRKQHAK